MRIDMPSFYTPPSPLAPANVMPAYNNALVANPRTGASNNPSANPGIVVDISPKAWATYESNKTEKGQGAESIASAGNVRCATCDSRKYQDASNDSSVSFQTPTNIAPEQSAAMVSAHENEHVSNEQANAERDGRKVVSQTVTLSSAICPECGRPYISGGVTNTVTASDNSKALAKAILPQDSPQEGSA